jgi:hypothetical protein
LLTPPFLSFEKKLFLQYFFYNSFQIPSFN